jgi:hypothetical protein
MKTRLAYQSFGDLAYNPDGERYWQTPDKIIGKWPNALQIALRALLVAFAGRTMTDISRAEYRKLLPEEKQGITLRTITGWWCRLAALGVIKRKRREDNPNVWDTIFTMPFQARLNEPVDPSNLAAAPQTFTTSTADPAEPLDPIPAGGATPEAIAEHVVIELALKQEGFEIRLDAETKTGFSFKPLTPDATATGPSADLRRFAEAYAQDIRELLERTRPARE